MKIRRFSAAAFAAALLSPALAACNDNGTGAAGTSASPTVSGSVAPSGTPGDAKQALLNSTNAIRDGNFRFSMSGAGSTAEGQVHEPSQSAEMRMTIGDQSSDLMMKLDLIHYKPDSWVKLELGGKAAGSVPGVQKLNLGKYQHLDQTRIKGNRALGFDFDKLDPAGSAVLTQGITEVRQTGEGTYAGTVDVSKAAEAGSLDPAVITALGAQAKSVPFTAKVDPQGRLSELVLQVPAAGQSAAQDIRITYTDYGNASAAQKPPADQVVEAPPEFYNLFD
ncbi:hypothetical protein ONA91_12995 [Micromonospora sp. DR5-3]|uniref:hypothetical protein n=1 Tax=unclassified Micromonospora TaxID=2617518 RepID=UPI0011D827CC|nr:MULTISPECIES: hypothetical protein [unclassified Micromonospora]MCW3815372.1 hypothetical protein [Micromonospora sp. DR5-3]TYC22827.1 hypothetical protein FXF52_18710 [Micromonospora sp. MP36]